MLGSWAEASRCGACSAGGCVELTLYGCSDSDASHDLVTWASAKTGAVDANGNDVTGPPTAGPYLQKYYGMQIAVPGCVGGYFWWYFAEDMVPDTKPMFTSLAAAMN